ncbi:PE-PPE domain-containing protein [Mycolicibacter heraklionensis]|uniref:PE-PPE domain-containing protein n=1 Tax=Mycolicibacter heraklionensis TaxID=512402 RepID=UPI000A88FEB5|nr:PE-PPE domain-containing protein [Mycolicibacter heraklionensis]
MTSSKLCAPIVVAGLVAGGVVAAPVVHAAHANVDLHVDVDLLADTAIFVGPTILSTPSATFARTAADLFLRPLGFDGGDDPASCLIGSAACDAPLQLLSTPGLIQVGHSSFAGAAEIVRTVQAELAANPGAYDGEHPLWIFGYSQGATAGSIAMAQLAHDGVDPQVLHFVFIGDPTAPDGKYPNAIDDGSPHTNFSDTWMLYGKETPNDAFPTTIYTIPGDPNADHTSTSPYGDFYEHMMYLGLTPDQVANHTATTDDLLTTISISTDFDQFGAWLNAWGHGLADSSWWDGLFYSAVAFVYSAFGKLEDFFGDWMGLDWGGVEETLDYWFPTA